MTCPSMCAAHSTEDTSTTCLPLRSPYGHDASHVVPQVMWMKSVSVVLPAGGKVMRLWVRVVHRVITSTIGPCASFGTLASNSYGITPPTHNFGTAHGAAAGIAPVQAS